jgi:hypothetical protein
VRETHPLLIKEKRMNDRTDFHDDFVDVDEEGENQIGGIAEAFRKSVEQAILESFARTQNVSLADLKNWRDSDERAKHYCRLLSLHTIWSLFGFDKLCRKGELDVKVSDGKIDRCDISDDAKPDWQQFVKMTKPPEVFPGHPITLKPNEGNGHNGNGTVPFRVHWRALGQKEPRQ